LLPLPPLLPLLLQQACPATCSTMVTNGSGRTKVTKEVAGECSASLEDGTVTEW
jgi:hypothetical protein